MPLGTGLGLDPGDIVLDGDPTHLHLKRHSAHFSVHVCCDQMTGLIKMPLGTKVGLGPGHIVLDGDPAPPHPPKGDFRPMSIVAKRSPISASAEHLLRH